ncbi:protein BCAP [Phaenicophaeus curvirostris]|uniref:protein BCAP n=1 Tax=Phaenicophaeus curvirostris TaxID=33595 RepID=UPI0037F100CF
MSSSTQSSSSLPVQSCSVPLLDSDLQEKQLLPLATKATTYVPPGAAGNLYSLIQSCENDCHKTTNAIQDDMYFTDLSKGSDNLECQARKYLDSDNIDTLMQKLSENETQNMNLRRKILEKERHVKELSSRLQLEKVNVQKEDQLSRSVKAIQDHLQCQIQRKEVENNELKAKIQTLERKIAEWKLQVGECKRQMLALRETSEEQKTALKKAFRFQKQRALRFEAAVENLTSNIREHEVSLSEIQSASDGWKSQHNRMVEGKTMLEIQREDLKKQVTSLLEDLKRKEEGRRNSVEEILGKLNSVNSENEKICLENEKLKASIATLEDSTLSVENELLNLREKAKVQETLVEEYRNQVQKLQTAVEELKPRYEMIFNGNKRITENKCLEVDMVRGRTEAELKELEHVCDLLKAAEEKQQGCQEKLISWERIHARKCKALRELQVQVSSTGKESPFSHDKDSGTLDSHSVEEENHSIQKKYEDLKRQLEKMELQNEELACQLRKEDESLQCSKLQLEEKIAEYNGLTRQLESALEEGRKMVAEELEKMSHKERALQTKLLVLETEVQEGQEEKKQLLCVFYHNEKRHEIHLKELENRLQKSENKNQSIQNYMQFLKASYLTMFG